VVCFDAGNLLPVVQRLKPTGMVCFAADNDHGTQAKGRGNPGIEKATNAAELIGAGVAWPKGIEGTDWADALKEWGQPGARRIEREIQAGARYVAGAKA
jgi:putative DNA primase/helicase